MLLVEPESDVPVAVVKQIVGLIARRIIFPLNVGDTVRRGDRIGMIKFGSRTELTIPMRLKPTIRVTVGQKVRGAADIIAVLGVGVHTTISKRINSNRRRRSRAINRPRHTRMKQINR